MYRASEISPGVAVDVRADVVIVAILRATGFLDRLFHRLEHFVAVDALVARHRIRDLQQFGTGVNGAGFRSAFCSSSG